MPEENKQRLKKYQKNYREAKNQRKSLNFLVNSILIKNRLVLIE